MEPEVWKYHSVANYTVGHSSQQTSPSHYLEQTSWMRTTCGRHIHTTAHSAITPRTTNYMPGTEISRLQEFPEVFKDDLQHDLMRPTKHIKNAGTRNFSPPSGNSRSIQGQPQNTLNIIWSLWPPSTHKFQTASSRQTISRKTNILWCGTGRNLPESLQLIGISPPHAA